MHYYILHWKSKEAFFYGRGGGIYKRRKTCCGMCERMLVLFKLQHLFSQLMNCSVCSFVYAAYIHLKCSYILYTSEVPISAWLLPLSWGIRVPHFFYRFVFCALLIFSLTEVYLCKTPALGSRVSEETYPMELPFPLTFKGAHEELEQGGGYVDVSWDELRSQKISPASAVTRNVDRVCISR